MAKLLLLFPATLEPQKAAEEAVQLAGKRGAELLVVASLDPELIERVSSTLSEEGFMGERVSDQLRGTLAREYRARAEQVARVVAERAASAGVRASWAVEEGDPGEICARLARTHEISLALLVAERRSWLTRLLARDTVRLPALAGCEVRVVEES